MGVETLKYKKEVEKIKEIKTSLFEHLIDRLFIIDHCETHVS